MALFHVWAAGGELAEMRQIALMKEARMNARLSDFMPSQTWRDIRKAVLHEAQVPAATTVQTYLKEEPWMFQPLRAQTRALRRRFLCRQVVPALDMRT